MKELQLTLHHLIHDGADMCSTEVQFRDLETIKSRSLHEGLSFLTISLPGFLDDFMSSIEEGLVTSARFIGWKKRGCLPAFLQGFTKLVFCTKTGRILDNANPIAVKVIRQVCNTSKKVLLNCADHRLRSAFDDYLSIDDEIGSVASEIPADLFADFKLASRMIWGQVFGKEINHEKFIPHHGPGSTQERILGNKKYVAGTFTWPKRLSEYFDPYQCLYSSEESAYEDNVDIPIIPVTQELPVRVISVPKTLKGPRIIALEPIAMQMAQQSVKDYVVDVLEKHPLTKGHINFSDQKVNQELALKHSKLRKYATIDLSAASDRVNKDMVWHMLSVNPLLRNLVFSTRSSCALVGDKLVYLNKFASMGSALCFPIEAMYFTTVLILASLKHSGQDLSCRSLSKAMAEIYVYGDDIIIPCRMVEAAFTYLEIFGLKVSKTKSFYKGRFRESCGMDAFDGVDVTPIYVRKTMPRSRSKAGAIISNVETSNQLMDKGYERTANYFKSKLEALTGNLPVCQQTCAGLGWWAEGFGICKATTRYNKRLQRSEVRTLIPTVSLKNDRINGYSALFKCLLQKKLAQKFVQMPWHKHWDVLNAKHSVSTDHLNTSSRRGAVQLKRRWTTPY